MIKYIKKKILQYELRRFLKKNNEHLEKAQKAREDFDAHLIKTLNQLKTKNK
jgi:hypothetical protein